MGNYLNNANMGTGRTVLHYSGGEQHSCAVLDNFFVKCWGRGTGFFLAIESFSIHIFCNIL